MDLDDTIVAVSSPPGAAVRGIVRLSGPEAIEIAGRLFSMDGRGLGDVAKNRCLDGRVTLEASSLPATVYLFRAPRSATRQDVVELHVLGAPGVLSLMVEACLSAGARRAEPGEFTARAYVAGAFDLSQVHAVAGMISARSDQQLAAAQRLLHGALGRTANQAREELAELSAHVEAALDFADEPIEFITRGELRRRLEEVLGLLKSTAQAGLRAERWGQLPQVLLVGAPNVGKSSLLNRLSGLDRAICAPVAGTTRDVLSAPMTVGDVACLLMDVAGSGDAVGDVHAKAQAAARRARSEADVTVLVVDASEVGRPAFGEDEGVDLVAANKCDLLSEEKRTDVRGRLARSWAKPVCLTSAVTGAGCDALKGCIGEVLHDRPVDIRDPAIALMAEHRDALRRAIASLERAAEMAGRGDEHLEDAELVAAELRVASGALGTLVGEDQTEEMLGRIFSRFCVGK